MKYKLIIFDLDGTILDTSEGILNSIKETIKHFDLPELSLEVLHTFIGPPIQESLATYYNLSAKSIEEVTNYFRYIYANKYLLYAHPYSRVYDVFHFIKSNELQSAIATYKREDYALKLLEQFHFTDYTNNIFGGDKGNLLKKKDIILKCISKANITDLNTVLMIGDTIHDATGAREAGIDFLGVTYGFGLKENESANIMQLNSINKLIDYLNN